MHNLRLAVKFDFALYSVQSVWCCSWPQHADVTVHPRCPQKLHISTRGCAFRLPCCVVCAVETLLISDVWPGGMKLGVWWMSANYGRLLTRDARAAAGNEMCFHGCGRCRKPTRRQLTLLWFPRTIHILPLRSVSFDCLRLSVCCL